MEYHPVRILIKKGMQGPLENFQQKVMREDLPYHITVTESLEVLCRRLADEHYDIVLCCYAEGEERHFKLFSQWADIPFIICVAQGQEEIAVLAMEAGARDYMVRDPELNYLKLFPMVIQRLVIQDRESLERRREKEELAALVAQNRAMLRAMPDMIFVNNRDGTYVDFNAENPGKLALPPEQISGKKMKDVGFSTEYLRLIMESIASVLESGEMRTLEYELRTPAGPGNFEARIVPLDLNHVLTMVRDITDQKKLQEELMRSKNLESIGILAAGIAHDFNNLLTGILGNISIARLGLDSGDKPFKLLGEAEKTSLTAAGLVQRLITFSKDEWLIRKEVELLAILKKTVHMFPESELPAYDMDISDELDPLYGDETQLSQVFFNLLRNAQEAMEPDQGPVILQARNVSIELNNRFSLEKGNYVRVTVEDRGKGISRENLHKIFTPYFSTKMNRGPKGTGLGMAISYAVVRKHKGNIIVESEVGKGTAFHVYLPAVREGVYFLKEEALAGLPELKGKLLLMDDDPLIVETTSEMLMKLGYRVDTCREGKEALDMYRRGLDENEAYDGVVLDIVNKIGMAGKETMQELVLLDPQVKALAISGYLYDFDEEELKSCGFQIVIPKPYKLETLTGALQEIL